MNKYLTPFLSVFVDCNIYANPIVNVIDGNAETISPGAVNFNDILVANQPNVTITNHVIIDNFVDWQSWNPNSVTINPGISLYITDINTITSGEKVNHVSGSDSVSIVITNTNRLYKANLTPDIYDNLYINITRETNYENVFSDARGKFLENIRLNNANDKMLLAMDTAKDMNEINSIMNSSYHFNPIILMNPIKTINRASMNDMFMNQDDIGIGANLDYVISDKINNLGSRIYMNNKYNDLYFNFGIKLNRFAYSDNFNEFEGFTYGLDIRAKQFFNSFWFDGNIGVNRASFDADNIYKAASVSNSPKGTSEYARFSVGHDFKAMQDFLFSPFIGTMFQKTNVMGSNDTDVNLHMGLLGKYNFTVDGIKYEYGAVIATDEKANWNIGINTGFLSIMDKAGANAKIDAFKDEFGTNYKFSINAKIDL